MLNCPLIVEKFKGFFRIRWHKICLPSCQERTDFGMVSVPGRAEWIVTLIGCPRRRRVSVPRHGTMLDRLCRLCRTCSISVSSLLIPGWSSFHVEIKRSPVWCRQSFCHASSQTGLKSNFTPIGVEYPLIYPCEMIPKNSREKIKSQEFFRKCLTFVTRQNASKIFGKIILQPLSCLVISKRLKLTQNDRRDTNFYRAA